MPAACESSPSAGKAGGESHFSDAVLTAVSFTARLIILFIGATLKLETAGREHLEKAAARRGGIIYAFWHNTMLPMAYLLRDKGINIMVSRSKDGEIISRTVSRLGAAPVRGSTKKRGAEAVVKIIRRIKEGHDAAITPDGPQGPRHRAQPGAAYIAAKTSSPVMPVAFACSRKITLKSWDGFIIPAPFTRAVVVYGEPVYAAAKDPIDDKTMEIENSLNKTTAEAEARLRKTKNRKADMTWT